jgi:hypothetical protein
MKAMISLVSRHAALLAALLFLGMAAFAGRIEGYSHLHHPLALLGAKPFPGAMLFNVVAFVVPGMLLAWVALRLRAAMPAGTGGVSWSARIGTQLMLISALSFAAQGLLPLDTDDFEGMRSARHAAAWMMWWIAFAAGGVLLAVGLRAAKDWHSIGNVSLFAALTLPVLALLLPQLVPAGIAQRLAFAWWFAWAIHAGYAMERLRQP